MNNNNYNYKMNYLFYIWSYYFSWNIVKLLTYIEKGGCIGFIVYTFWFVNKNNKNYLICIKQMTIKYLALW